MRMIYRRLIVVGIVLSLAGIAQSVVNFPASWRVDKVWYYEDGRVSRIEGDLTPSGQFAAPVDMAWAFLERNRSVFGLVSPREELKPSSFIPGFPLFFHQYFRGIPFPHRPAFGISITDNHITSVACQYYSNVSLADTVPVIDSTAARKIATHFPLWHEYASLDVHPRLVVFPDRDAFRLAWELDAGTVWFYVNAWSGDTLMSSSVEE